MSDLFVNVSCANIYREPTYHSEVESQAILWEKLELLIQKNDFLKVRCADGYEGWINRHQAVTSDVPEKMRLVYRPYGRIYEKPQKKALILRDYVSGSALPVLDEREGWARILLPDGRSGWVRDAAFGYLPRTGIRKMLLDLAREYLGVPYLWGGKTARGLDCSGYVQLVHKLCGINLRRDAWMQHQDARHIADNWQQGAPGDVLFFAEGNQKITHVGIKLNSHEVIHARGMVRINSMDPTAPNADMQLITEFVSVGSFI